MNIIWLAGFILLVFGHDYLDKNILWRLTTPDDAVLYAWLGFALPFFSGMYVSLLFIWNQLKVKDAALFFIVALPTLFVAVIDPLLVTFHLPLPIQLVWLVEMLNGTEYLTLVAGLTFLPSRTY